jgi:hypothetical protein
VKVAILVHWQGGKLMVGAVERLEGRVVVVLGMAAVVVVVVVLVVLTVVVAVSQM